MVPIKGFDFSDAPFNLGFSIAKSHDLPNVIYICMNGKLFSPEEIFIPQKKIEFIKEGRFTTVNENSIK